MSTRLKQLLYILLSFFVSSAALARDTENVNGHEVSAKQVILQIDVSKIAAPIASFVQQLSLIASADQVRALNRTGGLYVVHSPTNTVPVLLNLLKNLPSVVFAEPDYIVKPVVTPNDPYFSQEWDMYNTSTPGADIGATLAWGVSTGSAANVVGVVDTGTDYNHPELAANMWTAPSSFTVSLSWGQLTCPAGSHGYNAITKGCDPADDNDHGTHVSGTIGAIGNNGIGVAGVNWTTRIMGLKFLDSTGNGSVSDAIDAIEFGLQAKTIFGSAANLRVLSNSWGGAAYSQALLNEINKAGAADVLFVVAAGNTASSDDTSPTFPASYNAPNMITVAATTNADTLASFSNYGPNTVHLGAPGVNIVSTFPAGSYGVLSGTSMATPHVSGAAMLVLSKCSLNTAALRSAILNNVDLDPALQGLTSTGGRLNVNKAIRSCSSGGTTGSASFVKTDTTTQGTWKGVYGADGYQIVNDTTSNPSYVSVTPAGASQYTWAASTSDPRALQKGSSSTDRIASCWFTGSTFTVDLNFNDSNTHQVAMYFLDWDIYGGGRTQTVQIVDANGNVLDSRSLSTFYYGQYLVWNLSGHVIARITNTNASANAVMSAIFFGAGGSTTRTGTASFVRLDTTTSGTWKGSYGADGYQVINDSASLPAYASVTPGGISSYTWASSTSDPRAAQKGSSFTDRIAACWFSLSSFTVDLNFTDSNTHQVAMYMLDWDQYGGGRSESVQIVDANGNVLDSRSISGFGSGQYLVWNLSGHVIARFTNLNPAANVVVSAILFGGPGAGSSGGTAAYVKTDTSTYGTWKGVYGADGYNVINDSSSIPGYVSVTPSGNSSYTWASSTSSIMALQKGASSLDRIAACWFSGSSFTVDFNFNDSNTHQVALYFLDWDIYGGGRTQRVDILDPSGNVLDSRSLSVFYYGLYVVWNMSGHVTARITNTNASANAVMSGIFFR